MDTNGHGLKPQPWKGDPRLARGKRVGKRHPGKAKKKLALKGRLEPHAGKSAAKRTETSQRFFFRVLWVLWRL